MKNLIQTKIPNVYAVKVPKSYINGKLEKWHNEYFLKFAYKDDNGETLTEEIRLGEINFKELGTITKSEISFDASEVVGSTEIYIEQYDGILVVTPRFWDYETESFSLSDDEQSFRSALPEEIVWENSLGKVPNILKDSENSWSTEKYKEWQKAQEQITDKLLILQKV